MAIILKAIKVNLFISSVLFVFWYHSPNVFDKPRICYNPDLSYQPSTVFISLAVLAGDKTADPAARARPQERRFRSNSLRFLPFATLEAGGRSVEPAALYMGGYLPYAAVPPREGAPLLSISDMYRVC
jgi:hypothetical protein